MRADKPRLIENRAVSVLGNAVLLLNAEKDDVLS